MATVEAGNPGRAEASIEQDISRPNSTTSEEEALEGAVRQALQTFGPNHPTTIQISLEVANEFLTRQRLVRAEQLATQALTALESLPAEYDGARATALAVLGSIFLQQGRIAEGERLLRRALPGLERSFGADHSITIAALTRLSVVLIVDRPAQAIPFLLRTVAASSRVHGPGHQETLFAMQALGAAYMRSERLEQAEQIFLEIRETAQTTVGIEHPAGTAAADTLGMIRFAQRRYAEAEALFAQAFGPNLRHRGERNTNTINYALHLAAARLTTPERVAAALEPARVAARGMRSRLNAYGFAPLEDAQSSREMRWSGDAFSTLADALWAARSSQRASRPDARSADEAFSALQDAAAGAVDRAVTQTAVRRYAERQGGALGALVRERMSLAQQWDASSRQYDQALGQPEGGPGNASVIAEGQRATLEARLAAIDERLRVEFPDYFELVRPRPLSFSQAQRLLQPDEAILLVVPTVFGTHAIAISTNDVAWHRADLTRDQVGPGVAALLADVRSTMAGRGYTYNRRVAHALYDQIVAPVAATLSGRRHVFVVTSGALTSLPFGVLVTEPPQGRDDDPVALRATHWFADAHALIQLPSVQSLQLLRRGERRRAEQNNTFFGFGDPLLDGRATARGRGSPGASAEQLFSGTRSSGGDALADVAAIRRLNRLPGSATELESMRVALGAPASSLYLAERATERAFRAIDLSRANIIALATHGFVAGDLRAPAEPGLVFTPPAIASMDDDGFLTASEVATLRLDADWVILSACDTAAGDGSAGAPGLSGLARAFFYAGARNLLASHWPVADEVAPRLTVRTIELLRAGGVSRAEAVQRAMREVRNDTAHPAWAHPGAWAPFSLIGDGAR